MDFPSASTFGLSPGRRTAISLAVAEVEDAIPERDLMIIDFEELTELLDDELDDEAMFEVVFEPWDDQLDAYVIGEVDEEADDEDEGDDEDFL